MTGTGKEPRPWRTAGRNIRVGFIYWFAFCVGLVMSVRACHFVMPKAWRWLTDGQLRELDIALGIVLVVVVCVSILLQMKKITKV